MQESGKNDSGDKFSLKIDNKAELTQSKDNFSKIDTIDDICLKYDNKLENLSVYESKINNAVILSKIVVPKAQRNQGVGAAFMNDLISYADKNNKIIALTPDTAFGGTSITRLQSFYKRFGFVENKGKKRNFELSQSMYINPLEEKPFSLKINDKEQKYTTRRDIADYNENSYNKRGWAILNDVLSKNEVASFFSKLTGTYLEKGKDGLYIVPVGDKFGVNNKLIFTDGKFKNPSVEKVIEINLDSETDIEIVREDIYEFARQKHILQDYTLEGYYPEGILREYSKKNYQSYRQLRREREGRNSQGNSRHDTIRNDRSGDIGKAESAVNTISDTIKDTSSGGSFSLSTDSSEKMSGMDAKSRNIERGTVNKFLNETANMFGVPYSEKNGVLKKIKLKSSNILLYCLSTILLCFSFFDQIIDNNITITYNVVYAYIIIMY